MDQIGVFPKQHNSPKYAKGKSLMEKAVKFSIHPKCSILTLVPLTCGDAPMSVRDYLIGQRVWFETLLHHPSPSASRLAGSVHVSGRSVAEAVLVRTDGEKFLAVLAATHRIDMARLSLVLGMGPVRLAGEDEVMQTFGDCERGALPPFGRLYGLTTVVDSTLAGGSEIIFVGNARHEGLRMRYRDFETLEGPMRARFATAIEPRRRRPSHRRAG